MLNRPQEVGADGRRRGAPGSQECALIVLIETPASDDGGLADARLAAGENGHWRPRQIFTEKNDADVEAGLVEAVARIEDERLG